MKNIQSTFRGYVDEQKMPSINKIYIFFVLVTNEVPEQPVISPLSGAIFEKRIIEKYLLENGCDPITGTDLRADQLIELKSKYIIIYYKSNLKRFLFS